MISTQNVAILPAKSYMQWLTLNELSNTSGLMTTVCFEQESKSTADKDQMSSPWW